MTDEEPILGREGELASLASVVATGRAALVLGEAGVGKSTLLRTAASKAGRPAFMGGALDLLSFVPYLAIDRAVGRAGGGSAEAVAAHLVRRARGGVVVLDDLQWADEGTLEVVDAVAGHVPILAAVRSGDGRADEVAARLRRAGFAQLRLAPLATETAAALALRVRPSLGDAAARRLALRTGGNPLYLLELSRSDGEESLQLSIAHRVRGLDPAARSYLELMAVAREPLPLPGRRAIVTRLVDGGFASPAGAGVEVRHALIADAVEAALSPARARSCHMRWTKIGGPVLLAIVIVLGACGTGSGTGGSAGDGAGSGATAEPEPAATEAPAEAGDATAAPAEPTAAAQASAGSAVGGGFAARPCDLVTQADAEAAAGTGGLASSVVLVDAASGICSWRNASSTVEVYAGVWERDMGQSQWAAMKMVVDVGGEGVEQVDGLGGDAIYSDSGSVLLVWKSGTLVQLTVHNPDLDAAATEAAVLGLGKAVLARL